MKRVAILALSASASGLTSARRQHFDTLSDQVEGEKACIVRFLTFFNGTVISATLH
jgi:hypothetical protein